MSTQKKVLLVEAKIKKNGLRLEDVLHAARVNRSTWTRWKSGATNPYFNTWAAVERALNDLIEKGNAA